MEVICFGLSLPLSEHDTIRDCVNVYCEWLSALHPIPKVCVPLPVCEDPNLYARKMISHFHNLFVPRKGEVWTFLYSDLATVRHQVSPILTHRYMRSYILLNWSFSAILTLVLLSHPKPNNNNQLTYFTNSAGGRIVYTTTHTNDTTEYNVLKATPVQHSATTFPQQRPSTEKKKHSTNAQVYHRDARADTINRQALLCHRVLRTLQHLAQVSNCLTRETWEALLLFLLAINDTLLAPPTVKGTVSPLPHHLALRTNDVGDQLCERVLSVLFEVWLLACARCFPSPPLWKTLRETCMNWRHRVALVEQWNRVNLVLTARLLEFTYGPTFPELKICDLGKRNLQPILVQKLTQKRIKFKIVLPSVFSLCAAEDDSQLIPAAMSRDCVAQSWFRFLHCLGNPVALSRPAVVSQTQKFLQFAITSENVVDPCQHPCLAALPTIFLKAVRGVAGLVDAFLGIAQPLWEECGPTADRDKREGVSSHPPSATHSPTPPPQRRLAKSFSVAPSATSKGNYTLLLSLSLQGSSLRGCRQLNILAAKVVPDRPNEQSDRGIQPPPFHSQLRALISFQSHLSMTMVCRRSLIVEKSSMASLRSHYIAISLFWKGRWEYTTYTHDDVNDALKQSLLGSFHASTVGVPGRLLTHWISLDPLASIGFQVPASLAGFYCEQISIVTMTSLGLDGRPPLASARPKCNSILHLFGEWLFEAAYVGCEGAYQGKTSRSDSTSSKRPNSLLLDNRKGSLSLSQPGSLPDESEIPPSLTSDKYSSGRAEALGALCRIFCAKKTGEEILPVYLARFYFAMAQGLRMPEAAQTILSTSWTASHSMFSKSSMTSSPLYSLPMRTLISIGMHGGHYRSRFPAPMGSSLVSYWTRPGSSGEYLTQRFLRQASRRVATQPGCATCLKELLNCLMLQRSNNVLTFPLSLSLSLPTITLPPTATHVHGTLTLPPHLGTFSRSTMTHIARTSFCSTVTHVAGTSFCSIATHVAGTSFCSTATHVAGTSFCYTATQVARTSFCSTATHVAGTSSCFTVTHVAGTSFCYTATHIARTSFCSIATNIARTSFCSIATNVARKSFCSTATNIASTSFCSTATHVAETSSCFTVTHVAGTSFCSIATNFAARTSFCYTATHIARTFFCYTAANVARISFCYTATNGTRTSFCYTVTRVAETSFCSTATHLPGHPSVPHATHVAGTSSCFTVTHVAGTSFCYTATHIARTSFCSIATNIARTSFCSIATNVARKSFCSTATNIASTSFCSTATHVAETSSCFTVTHVAGTSFCSIATNFAARTSFCYTATHIARTFFCYTAANVARISFCYTATNGTRTSFCYTVTRVAETSFCSTATHVAGTSFCYTATQVARTSFCSTATNVARTSFCFTATQVAGTHSPTFILPLPTRSRECGETLASVLLNSADLFRLDLDGVLVLVPHVIEALETVLPDKELKLRSPQVSKTELRRASIHLLLSMLVLPLHFQNLPIKELCIGGRPDRSNPLTFAQLKPRLMNLLINALQVEADPHNAQMLLVQTLEDDEPFHGFWVNDDPMLDIGEREAHQGATDTESDMLVELGPGRPKLMRTGRRGRPTKIYQPAANRANQNLALNNDPPYDKDTGHSNTASSQQTMEYNSVQTHDTLPSSPGGLLLCVQDSAAAEEVEQVTQPDNTGPGSDTTSNLLSSVDTISSLSLPSDSRSLGGETPDLSDPTELCYVDYPAALGKNSAHALFVRATYLVCHRLISSWKTDLNVSLAALELLAGLARTHIRETDALECKRAVKWLCDYIVYQCWRPPPAHSKDLHSTIVAAFQCAGVWLVAHPYLLQDKDCLTTVLEVVELGISGTKSQLILLECNVAVLQGKPGEPVRMKDEKELKPASMRVRDAAEALLTLILEQVGYFPSPCGAQSLSSLLDEVSLLRHCNSWPGGDATRAVERFRYFVVENSTLLALLEEPLGNDQDPQPTVTVLIRGPSGRHAWTMQLRHLPRHKSGTKYHAPNPGRPVPMANVGVKHDVKHRYFPDNIDKIPHCSFTGLSLVSVEYSLGMLVLRRTPMITRTKPGVLRDHSIPSLESLLSEEGQETEHLRLSALVERQGQLEERALQQREERDTEYGDTDQECAPPPICHEFQTARLFLAHFGFLSLDSPNGSLVSPLTALDSSVPGFSQDLESLDSMSPRSCDTVHVFYVRAGQRTPDEILANVMNEQTVHPHFLEFLLSLGWPVSVFKHPGWTGHLSSSWRVTQPPQGFVVVDHTSNSHGGCLYNGESQVLYWADATSEIAFVVPSQREETEGLSSLVESSGSFSGDGSSVSNEYLSNNGLSGQIIILVFVSASGWFERSESEGSGRGGREKPRTLSLDLDKQGPSQSNRRSGGAPHRHQQLSQSNTKILVVWLESLEDQLNFPLGELLPSTSTGLEGQRPAGDRDCSVVFLHLMHSGLLRVKLQHIPTTGRAGLATPLVDGMVVSRRVLGSLVRQTALNTCRRRRLDNDSYQPPHVRRRLKVQDLVQKYKCELSEPELLTYLFSSTPA
uniref:Rap-GAP domain-containing protein n=1 Tax=Timema shepardi TaxID=629360 RepID=A0A7R9ALN1_TIMSH|nr:unnamed protein product [Timema shepardi]